MGRVLQEALRQPWRSAGQLFDDAAPVLARLGASARLVLISNKGIEAVESSLARFGIRDFFALVLAEEQGQPKKPDPDVFARRILPAFPDARPEDCLVVGDTAADLEFARNIGADSCYAAYGYGDRATCDAIGYTFSIDGLRELLFLCDAPAAAGDGRAAAGRRMAELEALGD